MKRCLVLALLSAATTASAELPVPDNTPQTLVERKLTEPLAARDRERSRFSRALLPPLARRVRIHENATRPDATGATFVSFSVDERVGYVGDEAEPKWRKDAITGCVYPGTREIFVLQNGQYLSSDRLLGKRGTPAPPHACRAESRA